MLPLALLGGRLVGNGGTAALLAVLMTGGIWFVTQSVPTGRIPKATVQFLAGSIPLIAVYMLGALRQPEMQSLVHVAQLVLVVAFTAGFSLFQWGGRNLMPLMWSSLLLLGSSAVQWLLVDRSFGFSGAFSHRNALAFASYALLYIPLNLIRYVRRNVLLRAGNAVTISSGIVLLVVTSSRSSWIAALASVAVYATWPFFTRSRFRYWVLFLLAIAAAVGGTATYILSVDAVWGAQLNELLVEWTGRRLFSGRNLFWGDLLNAIQAKPLIGYGAGALAENFTDYGWSSHNLYLQVTLQVGLVGLVALFMFFATIWHLLWAGRGSRMARLSAAFFIGILLREVFEVSMIQNNLQSGVFAWLIVAAGLGASRITDQGDGS